MLIRPSHISIFLRDLFRSTSPVSSDQDHLAAAIDWLCLSQDVTGCGASSAGYSLLRGWQEPYPETTGYIIPTLLKFAVLAGDEQYLQRAQRMGDWEIEIQLPTGAVRGGVGINDYPIVFNTGQVILGWSALYAALKVEKYLEAAKKAADWLISVQDTDGKWSQSTYQNTAHAYHTRVAWPVFEVYNHAQERKYFIAAEKHVQWVLSLVKENGWIDQMYFWKNKPPFTHTIAYTLRGLLECSHYLEGKAKEDVLAVIENAAEKLMFRYEWRKKDPYMMPKFLPGTFDENFKGNGKYSCLTGNAQMAIIWLKLFEISKDARFLNTALKILDQVKSMQNIKSGNSAIRGAIAGSYPMWGDYIRLTYPNWATKFFADALMLQESVMQELEK